MPAVRSIQNIVIHNRARRSGADNSATEKKIARIILNHGKTVHYVTDSTKVTAKNILTKMLNASKDIDKISGKSAKEVLGSIELPKKGFQVISPIMDINPNPKKKINDIIQVAIGDKLFSVNTNTGEIKRMNFSLISWKRLTQKMEKLLSTLETSFEQQQTKNNYFNVIG